MSGTGRMRVPQKKANASPQQSPGAGTASLRAVVQALKVPVLHVNPKMLDASVLPAIPASDHAPALAITSTAPPQWQAAISLLAKYAMTQDKSEKITVLIDYVKALARVTTHGKRMEAAILRQNCQTLTEKVIAGSPDRFEEGTKAIQQAFKVTVNDQEGEEPKNGRTRECYAIAVCLLMLYVRMRAFSLAEGILKAIDQYRRNLPPLSTSSPATQVQFLFYRGLFMFFEQNYAGCTKCYDEAMAAGHKFSKAEFERLMAFYIPAMFISHNREPTPELWAALPRLSSLYQGLITAVRQGNWQAYRSLLESRFDELRDQRIVLAIEYMQQRLRLNLLRRTWEILGRPRRIPISMYSQALKTARIPTATQDMAGEFYISQFIFEGTVKGYIHHELQLLMLSSTTPFPLLVKPIQKPVN